MQAEDLLQAAIAAIEKGEKSSALRWLGRLLEQQPRHAEAWYWLSKTQDDPLRKQECLVRALRFQPDHAQARADLEALEAQRLFRQSATQPARLVSSSVAATAQPQPISKQTAPLPKRRINLIWLWLSLMGLLLIGVLCLSALLLTTSYWQPTWDQWVNELDFAVPS